MENIKNIEFISELIRYTGIVILNRKMEGNLTSYIFRIRGKPLVVMKSEII